MAEQLEQEVVEEVEATEIDGPEEVAEPEPKEEESGVTFSDEQQKFINEHIVGKKVAKLREVERRAHELEQQLSQYQKDPEVEPAIPPVPDVWDDKYEQKLQERDNALIKHAQWRAQQESDQRQRQQLEAEQARLHQRQMIEKVQTYTERAKSLGISEQDLAVAGGAVSQFGISNDLTSFILEDDSGPALTLYLSRNLQELQRIQSMNPLQAAVHLATQIKPRVARSIKRQAPPEPAEGVSGAGARERERGPKGAVFE